MKGSLVAFALVGFFVATGIAFPLTYRADAEEGIQEDFPDKEIEL